MRTSELMNEWLTDSYRQKRIKYRTYARYRDIIAQHINPEIGSIPENEIITDNLRFLVNKKLTDGNLLTGKPLSSSSINGIISVIKNAFGFAAEQGWIESSPASKMKQVRFDDEKQITVFSRREQIRLEQCIAASQDERLFGIKLCLYTGLRIGELLALKWENVNLKTGMIDVRETLSYVKSDDGEWHFRTDTPKTKSSKRCIPLPPGILGEMKVLKRDANSQYVISQKGGVMPIRTYQYIFGDIQRKLKLRPKGFHALRHTFATRAIECGMDIKTLSEILGHNSPTITLKRYAHSMMETKRKMIVKLEKSIKK